MHIKKFFSELNYHLGAEKLQNHQEVTLERKVHWPRCFPFIRQLLLAKRDRTFHFMARARGWRKEMETE